MCVKKVKEEAYSMHPIVQSFIEKAGKTVSVDDLNKLLTQTFHSLGFKQWAYQFKKENDTPFVLGDFPDEWVDRYIDKNYSSIDPVIIEGHKESVSFQWHDLVSRLTLNEEQESFMKEAEEAGLNNGVGIPIRYDSEKKALLSMVSEDQAEELDKTFKKYQSDLHLLGLIYHQRVQDMMQKESFSAVKLTNREKEVLKWAALGKTSWETSCILNISERTVNFHIENSRKKLASSSKQHAVITAVMHKIINI